MTRPSIEFSAMTPRRLIDKNAFRHDRLGRDRNEPEHYFRPPYVGPRGWIGVYLDVPLEWKDVEDAIAQAHQTVLTKVSQAKRRQ